MAQDSLKSRRGAVPSGPDAIAELNAKAESDQPLTIADLIMLMAVLRDREHGCPWDVEQDFATIAPYTIEEAYEVADAIARGDLHDLKDELGDLLLQVVYHAQMAEEAGEFDFAAVADVVTRKMIRRHPHVFGDEDARVAGAVRGMWDRIKAEEAADKAAAKGGAPVPESALDGVPLNLPALTRSVKIQKRAAKTGFDWVEASQIITKLKEEIGELEEEITKKNEVKMHEEFGDMLFVMANLARRLSIDPEQALSDANYKFTRRFHYIEKRLKEMGRPIEDATLDEMEALWVEVKQIERGHDS
jgi:ATP diphosphatase